MFVSYIKVSKICILHITGLNNATDDVAPSASGDNSRESPFCPTLSLRRPAGPWPGVRARPSPPFQTQSWWEAGRQLTWWWPIQVRILLSELEFTFGRGIGSESSSTTCWQPQSKMKQTNILRLGLDQNQSTISRQMIRHHFKFEQTN